MTKLEQYFEAINNKGEPLWKRIFYLDRANGGFSVNGWGSTTNYGGHRSGLLQEEALELIYVHGRIVGLIDGLGLSEEEAGKIINNYRDKYHELFKSLQYPIT